MLKNKKDRKQIVLKKELQYINKQEEKLRKDASGCKSFGLKEVFEKEVPQLVYENLEKAFCKAFYFMFQKGNKVIGKSCSKDNLSKNFEVLNYAFEIKKGRREIKKIRRSARSRNIANMAITTAEGAGLGIFGIGLPDILIFIGILLKGIYETALCYGYDYEKAEEKIFILKMIEASLSKGEDWEKINDEINLTLEEGIIDGFKNEEDILSKHITSAAKVLALDMIAFKFIQGLPLIGIIGGAVNPFYYRKVLRYVQLKYQKRFLLEKMKKIYA